MDDASQSPEPDRLAETHPDELSPEEREQLLDEFYSGVVAPSPSEALVLVLDRGHSIDWAAARRSIDRIGAADLDYISFVLGLSAVTAGTAERALAQARELLHAELDLLAAALADPDSDLRIYPSDDGALVLRADPTPGDELEPVGIYGALLRLSLLYVPEAAGLHRPGVPDPAAATGGSEERRPTHPDGWRRLIARTRSACPHAQRRKRHI